MQEACCHTEPSPGHVGHTGHLGLCKETAWFLCRHCLKIASSCPLIMHLDQHTSEASVTYMWVNTAMAMTCASPCGREPWREQHTRGHWGPRALHGHLQELKPGRISRPGGTHPSTTLAWHTILTRYSQGRPACTVQTWNRVQSSSKSEWGWKIGLGDMVETTQCFPVGRDVEFVGGVFLITKRLEWIQTWS